LFFTTGKEGGEKTKEGLAKGGEGAEQTGSLIIRNFVKGLKFWGGVYTVIGDIRKAIWENLGSMAGNAWDWGYNLAKSFRNGMESAGKWIESTVVDISSKIKNWWESLSPPKEGPLKNIDKWGENLVKTYADSMTKGIPYLERAIGDVSGGMGASFAGGASAAISTDRTATTEVAPTGATINKNYYIQPGQMIATRGEVRSFVKLLKEYDQFEEDR